MTRGANRRRGMSTLQAVLLLGAGFLVVWGLMDVWKEAQDPLQAKVDDTLRGKMGKITPGNGQVPSAEIDDGSAANQEPKFKLISHEPTKPNLPPTGGAEPVPTGANPGEAEGKTSLTGFLDGFQTTLDIIGLVPVIGEPVDLFNAGVSALRGDWVGAGLGLTSAIPFLGWGGTAAKIGRKLPLEQLVKHADDAKRLLKEAEAANDLKKAEEARELIAAVEKEQARRAAAALEASAKTTKLGQLRKVGVDTWDSSGGLRYAGLDPDGLNRVQHVIRHSGDDLARAGKHGVFDAGRSGTLGVIDEAWVLAQKGGSGVTAVTKGNRTVYTVDMGRRVGYVGGQAGAAAGNPAANYVQIVIENGKEVITAFPVIP